MRIEGYSSLSVCLSTCCLALLEATTLQLRRRYIGFRQRIVKGLNLAHFAKKAYIVREGKALDDR